MPERLWDWLSQINEGRFRSVYGEKLEEWVPKASDASKLEHRSACTCLKSAVIEVAGNMNYIAACQSLCSLRQQHIAGGPSRQLAHVSATPGVRHHLHGARCPVEAWHVVPTRRWSTTEGNTAGVCDAPLGSRQRR